MIAGLGKSQINWHQALVEVALIGVGVLIALSVDSWWDERRERNEEIEYLQALQRDFQTNREELTDRINAEMQLISYGKKLHSYLASGLDEVPTNELDQLIGDFYMLQEWQPITGTFDEMVASGRLLYLRNEALRKRLSQYEHLLKNIQVREQFGWSNWLQEQSPFLRRHLNVAHFGWVDNYQPEIPFQPDLHGLQSREFHNLVSTWMVARHDIVVSYRDAIESGDEILELIAFELNAN